jgi:RNA polymerase sigma-70 factor (ECF subfamily)
LHDRRRDVPSEPVPWLFTIARRRLIDSYRRGYVDARARARLAIDRVSLEDEDIERINELASGPDLALALALQLPAAQRDALIARVLDERSYADIAAETNTSETSVRMRVSRALRTLRQALAPAADAGSHNNVEERI